MASLLAWLCGARAPTGYMPTASKDLENALSDALRTSCGFNGESYGRALTVEERRKLYDKKVLPLHQDHIKRLPTITSSIDDDTEDDATGEARARLREESETRRRAEAQELRERNKEYRAALSSVTSLTDSKIWDDGEGSAGAMRSVVATRSQARKAEEAKQLAAENEENRSRLSRVTSRTDDGD